MIRSSEDETWMLYINNTVIRSEVEGLNLFWILLFNALNVLEIWFI